MRSSSRVDRVDGVGVSHPEVVAGNADVTSTVEATIRYVVDNGRVIAS
jgi:hypothetical protein